MCPASGVQREGAEPAAVPGPRKCCPEAPAGVRAVQALALPGPRYCRRGDFGLPGPHRTLRIRCGHHRGGCRPAHRGPTQALRGVLGRGAQGAAAGGREPRRRGRQCPPSTLRVVGPGRGPGGPWWCPFRGASAPLRPPGVAGSSGAGVAVQTAWEPAAQPLLSSCTVVPSRRTSFCPGGSLWGVPPRFRSFLFSPPLCALRGRHSHGRSLGSPRPRSARAGGPSPDVRSRAHAAVCAGGRFSRALICRA